MLFSFLFSQKKIIARIFFAFCFILISLRLFSSENSIEISDVTSKDSLDVHPYLLDSLKQDFILSNKKIQSVEAIKENNKESRLIKDEKGDNFCPPYFTETMEVHNIKKWKDLEIKIENVFSEKIKNGDIALITRSELEEHLSVCQMKFFDELFDLDPTVWGIYFPKILHDTKNINMKVERISPKFSWNNKNIYVPRHYKKNLETMLSDMQKEIGRNLFISSGYRSPLSQGILFLKYGIQYKSAKVAGKRVGLPGRSEHGFLQQGAIDFITHDGIDTTLIRKRKEFFWLQDNASKYGFFETFDFQNRYGHNYKPWHWHYEGVKSKISDFRNPLGTVKVSAKTNWGKYIESLPLKPMGTHTRLLFRKEWCGKSKCISKFENKVYEKLFRIKGVIDIPVTKYQDCSKQMIRLLVLYAQKKKQQESFQFPIEGVWKKFSQSDEKDDFESFVQKAMIMTGTLTWRKLLIKIDEKDAKIGDLVIQPNVDFRVDDIYQGATVGHTSIIVGKSFDPEKKITYYLFASGSLPVTDFRVSRATNGYQGLEGWFDIEGYKLRTNAKEIEFYSFSSFAEQTIKGGFVK